MAGRLRRAGLRLLRREDGAASLMMIFMVLAMMMVAGFAVDVMRHERERVRLQATLDQAVLAAADVGHDRDPEEIVIDWFARAGLSDALDADGIEVERTTSRRAVTARASADMPTLLMHLLGVEMLEVATVAAAQEGHNDIEISLVLDLSSSMAWHSRLERLEVAANDFVELVTERMEGAPGVTTLSIVPYSMSVNLGHEIASHYNIVPPPGGELHRFSRCVLLGDEHFRDTALPPTRPLTQYPHFDSQDGDDWGVGYTHPEPSGPRRVKVPLCPHSTPDDPGINPVTPLGTDATALHLAIAALEAYDATGIDAGLRWGVALLDPSTRPVVDALVASGTVDPAAAGRPFDYDRPDTLKILILMTDGDPDGQRDRHPKLTSLPSNVWYDRVSGRHSVLVRGRYLAQFPYDDVESSDGCDAWDADDRATIVPDGIERVAPNPIDDDCAPMWYWVQDDNPSIERQWAGVDWQNPVFRDHPNSSLAGTEDENDWSRLSGDLVRLSHDEVYDRFTGYDAREFLYRPARDNRDAHWRPWLSDAEWAILDELQVPKSSDQHNQASADRLVELCGAAKDNGILIFTVGFELDRVEPGTSRNRAYDLMRNCATSPEAHFFDVRSIQKDGAIGEAFRVIESQIEQLRLTR